MPKINSIMFIFLIVLIISYGCAPPVVKTKLDQLFENNFEGLETPDVNWIKEGESRKYPYSTYDQVWDSAILVMMQRGSIVRSLKDTGIIVTVTTPALALFVEKGEVITAYMNWLHYLYESADKSKGGYWLISDEKKKMVQAFEITKALLDRISTQVYAGEKWKWLKVESEE